MVCVPRAPPHIFQSTKHREPIWFDLNNASRASGSVSTFAYRQIGPNGSARARKSSRGPSLVIHLLSLAKRIKITNWLGILDSQILLISKRNKMYFPCGNSVKFQHDILSYYRLTSLFNGCRWGNLLLTIWSKFYLMELNMIQSNSIFNRYSIWFHWISLNINNSLVGIIQPMFALVHVVRSDTLGDMHHPIPPAR